MDDWYPIEDTIMYWENPSPRDWHPYIDIEKRDDLTGHPDFPPSKGYEEWYKIAHDKSTGPR